MFGLKLYVGNIVGHLSCDITIVIWLIIGYYWSTLKGTLWEIFYNLKHIIWLKERYMTMGYVHLY